MRTSLIDSARRTFLGAVRGVYVGGDDTKKMQTVIARHLHNEQHPATERFQNYGRTSFPLPPDRDGKGAETIAVFLGGSRSHPVIVAVDDRRHRPTGGKAGDVVDYHYKGNAAAWTEAGWAYAGGDAKLSASWTIGNLTVTWKDGRASIKVGGGDTSPAVIVTSDTIFLGGDPDKGGSFDFVQTVSGPSTNVKAKFA